MTAPGLLMVKGAYDRAGGPETVLQTVIQNLDRTRYHPHLALVARHDQVLPPVLDALTHEADSSRIAWTGLAGAPASARTLSALLRAQPGAVLHTNDMRSDLLGYMATRLHRRPWIAHVHGWLGETHAGRHKFYERVDRWLIRGADLVLVGSSAMANEVRQAGARWTEIVWNGIPAAGDPAAFDEAAAALRASLVPPGSVVAGVLGRLHPGKGQSLVIEAAASLHAQGRPIEVLLVGEGPAEAEYRAQAATLGIAAHVHFAGLVADIRPYLRAMDMVCVPSLKDSLPLTALEAMAVARPVIASRAGDLPRAIEDGVTGLLIPVGSALALADAIRTLADDPARRAQMGRAGRGALIAQYTPAAMLRQLEGYCDALLAQKAGHG